MALKDAFIIKEAGEKTFTQAPMIGAGSGRAQVMTGKAFGAPAPPANDRNKLAEELRAAIAAIRDPVIRDQFKDAVKRMATEKAPVEKWSKLIQLARAEGGR